MKNVNAGASVELTFLIYKSQSIYIDVLRDGYYSSVNYFFSVYVSHYNDDSSSSGSYGGSSSGGSSGGAGSGGGGGSGGPIPPHPIPRCAPGRGHESDTAINPLP